MELALIILAVVVLTVIFASALSVILAIRVEDEPREQTFAPIVEDEGGPLVHGGGLGDLRSSRQPTPKDL
jgi:hypothetical protein